MRMHANIRACFCEAIDEQKDLIMPAFGLLPSLSVSASNMGSGGRSQRSCFLATGTLTLLAWLALPEPGHTCLRCPAESSEYFLVSNE